MVQVKSFKSREFLKTFLYLFFTEWYIDEKFAINLWHWHYAMHNDSAEKIIKISEIEFLMQVN